MFIREGFVFILLTRMRPIKIRILNHFLRVAGHGLPIVLIKNKIEERNLRVRFLPLKIVFFWGVENDNIFSSKSYRVTKSGILGFLFRVALKKLFWENKDLGGYF